MGAPRIRLAPGLVIYLRWHTWWADVRDHGLRIRRSLDTHDRPEAERCALRLAPAPRAPLPVDTLAKARDRYFAEYSPLHHRPATVRRSRQAIDAFLAFVGAGFRPSRLTRAQFLDFQRRRADTLARSSVNSDLSHLKAFVNWCRAEGLIPGDPLFKVVRLRINRTHRRTPTPDEVARIVDVLGGDAMLRDFVLVAANTGMRPAEVLHVRGCDLDVAKKVLRITAWGEWQTKDAEDRTLALNETVLEVLTRRKLAAGNDEIPLFGGQEGNVREMRSFYHRFKRKLPVDLAWVDLYDFRHFFASESVRRGMPSQDLRLYLGHAELSTTLKYYMHVRAEELPPPPELARIRG